MEQKTVLITFGAGSRGWRQAAKRIHREASASGLFSEVEIYDERWIQESDPELWTLIESCLTQGENRGFGFWMWKPALLKWADEKWPDAQILYVDSGFHIDKNRKLIQEFRAFLNVSFQKGGIAFEQIGLREKYWTKLEVFEYFKIESKNQKANQLYAGFILMPPGNTRKKLFNEFYQLTKYRNGFLFNDTLSIQQSKEFFETRHDQSIFSILWRKYKLTVTPDLTRIENMNKFLFIAARNRTGFPANSPAFLLKVVRGINKLWGQGCRNG